MGLMATPAWDVLPLGAAQGGPRYLVVHLPAFALERCGWRADALVGLVAEQRNATRIVALTPAARALGLFEGMVVAEARSLAEGVVLEPQDDAGEAADRAELVAAFERFGDRVAPYGDAGLLIEIRGVTGWFGGEHAVMARVRERLHELGHVGRVAVADHPRAAWALAQHASEDVLVPEGQGAAALAPLPLAVLDPSDVLRDAWMALGLRTVGDWARLDAASVAGRFGDEGVELHRVARGAVGPAWHALPALAPLDRLRLRMDDEVEHIDGVQAALEPGLLRLREQLAARDLVAARLTLRMELAWGGSVRVRVRVAQPTRDPGILARLLHDRLTRTTLTAPVTGLVLHAEEAVPDGNGQHDLLERREGAGQWSELVARLTDVLGSGAVVQAHLVAAWRPEATWQACDLPERAVSDVLPVKDDPVERQEGQDWVAPRARPSVLRSPPMPLRVRDVQGVPEAIHTRRGWRPIRRCRGPEKLEGDWWHANGGFARDYWVVGLTVGTAWLFYERDQWFLHGWFD